MNNELLQRLNNGRKTYKDMIDFCADNMVLNNQIYDILCEKGFYFNTYCGEWAEFYDENGNQISEEEYGEDPTNKSYCTKEPMQYFVIGEGDAQRFKEYTNEIVIYNENLDLYLLCVTHWGTAWDCVSANWKSIAPNEDK